MNNAATLARRRLDERLKAYAGIGAAPPMGWVRAIRDALGLTGAQLVRRIGIRPASLSDLEKNEATSRITLATLRCAAEALDCTLVNALIPNQSLQVMVEEAASLRHNGNSHLCFTPWSWRARACAPPTSAKC